MSTTIIGLVVLVLSQFVPVEEVESVMEAVGIIIAWYGRIRLGDLHIWGGRKIS